MIAGAALLAAALTLAADRVLMARREPQSSPVASPTATATPRPRVIVEIQTAEPQPTPPPLPTDEREQVLHQLQQASDAQWSGILILKAERQVALALEALLANNASQADGQLVAAKAALDEAFWVAPEDLKPQITNERQMIGHVRANLEINPRDLDEELRSMRDRLLELVPLRTQE